MIITRRGFLQGAALNSFVLLGSTAKTYSKETLSFSSNGSLDYFDRVANYVDLRFASRAKTSISRITTLDDMVGNTYTLIECEPTGFYILHDASGQFAEYDEESPSPYQGAFGKLVYAGPGSYFCETTDGFVDLGRDLMIEGKASIIADQIANDMSETHDRLIENPNHDLLRVLQPSVDYMGATEVLSATSELVDRQITTSIYYDVTDAKFFYEYNKVYCGYYEVDSTHQCCGYVAANLVYRYWNYRGRVALYNDFTSSYGVQHGVYSHWLYDCGHNYLGLSNLTYAWDIAGLMNAICSYYGMTQAASWEFLNWGAWTEITTNDRPIILFGRPGGSYGDHAFVAYGVEIDSSSNYFYRCHMGKDNIDYKRKVNMSVLVGSNMKCSY